MSDLLDWAKREVEIAGGNMSLKEFFQKNKNLYIELQHLDLYGGAWRIHIYDVTRYIERPVFKHIIPDAEIEACVLDFETVIMTPILNWFKTQAKE